MSNVLMSSKPKELVKSDRSVLAGTPDVQAVISLCEGYTFSCSGIFNWGGGCNAFWDVDKENDVIF